MNYPKTSLTLPAAPESEGKLGGAGERVDINARGLHWRESLGDALHAAVHPDHPWAHCLTPDAVYDTPDAVYDEWMPRFLAALRADGFDVL